MRFTQAAIAAILATAAESRTFAVLRFNGKALTTGRMDPIVNPGVASGHSHVIQGGNAFKLDMTDDDPLKSTCTTAKIKNDKSNYWTPSLFFQDPSSGKLESVEMFYMNVYYFFENDNEKVTAFPKGLRMFTGNPSARTPPKTAAGVLDASQGDPMGIQWTCPRNGNNGKVYPAGSTGMNGVGMQDPNVNGQGVGFPDVECDGFASPLRADIHFPSCYDPSKGVRSYKDNMVWPVSGRCPAGTMRVPHLFYEVYWDTLKFKGRWTPGQGNSPWVLSNGDKTGYSLHADFINGWDEKTLQTIIDTCNAGSSGMDGCPNIPGGLNDVQDCSVPNLVPETVVGVMDKLPGGNVILKWGESAAPAAPAPGAPAPPVTADPYNPPAPTTTKASVPIKSDAPPAPVPTTKAAPAPLPTTTAAIPTVPAPTPVVNTRTRSRQSTTLQIVATPAPVPTPAPNAGGSVVTSIVSETETIYTTITLPAPGASSAPTAIAGYTYKGCFSDNVNARVLTGVKFANIGDKQVSTTKCIDWCSTRGFTLAGTEFGGQCFCGNALVGSSKIAEAKCNVRCEGAASETCGGPDALSIYEKTKTTKRTLRHMHRHAVAHVESI